MKNTNLWQPSVYVFRKSKLRASKDRKKVGISSRLIVDIVARLYQNNIPEHFTGKLLDLGCGNVPLYAAYKDYVNENVCVDWSNTLHKNHFLDIETDINQALPISDETFNTVVLSDVLEHIRKPEALLAEVNRVMLPEGKFIMNVPFFYWLHEQPFDYFRYTKFSLESMLNDAGFKVLKLQSTGGAPEVLIDIFNKNILALPVLGKVIVITNQYLMKLFLKTKIGRRISKKTAEKFPLGYFVVAQKSI